MSLPGLDVVLEACISWRSWTDSAQKRRQTEWVSTLPYVPWTAPTLRFPRTADVIRVTRGLKGTPRHACWQMSQHFARWGNCRKAFRLGVMQKLEGGIPKENEIMYFKKSGDWNCMFLFTLGEYLNHESFLALTKLLLCFKIYFVLLPHLMAAHK